MSDQENKPFLKRFKELVSQVKEIFEHFRYTESEQHTLHKSTNYKNEDLAYMQSLSAAVVEHEPRYSSWIISIIATTFFLLLLWMA